jgi:hypothetical protein
MTIRLKHAGLKAEWRNLLIINPDLSLVVLWIGRKLGSVTITEIFRTDEMQVKYYPKKPGKISVHQLWRGVDISVKGLEMSVIKQLEKAVNILFPYGKHPYNTAFYHDIGLGAHIHLQNLLMGKTV